MASWLNCGCGPSRPGGSQRAVSELCERSAASAGVSGCETGCASPGGPSISTVRASDFSAPRQRREDLPRDLLEIPELLRRVGESKEEARFCSRQERRIAAARELAAPARPTRRAARTRAAFRTAFSRSAGCRCARPAWWRRAAAGSASPPRRRAGRRSPRQIFGEHLAREEPHPALRVPDPERSEQGKPAPRLAEEDQALLFLVPGTEERESGAAPIRRARRPPADRDRAGRRSRAGR